MSKFSGRYRIGSAECRAVSGSWHGGGRRIGQDEHTKKPDEHNMDLVALHILRVAAPRVASRSAASASAHVSFASLPRCADLLPLPPFALPHLYTPLHAYALLRTRTGTAKAKQKWQRSKHGHGGGIKDRLRHRAAAARHGISFATGLRAGAWRGAHYTAAACRPASLATTRLVLRVRASALPDCLRHRSPQHIGADQSHRRAKHRCCTPALPLQRFLRRAAPPGLPLPRLPALILVYPFCAGNIQRLQHHHCLDISHHLAGVSDGAFERAGASA